MKLRIIPTSEGYYDAWLNQYIYQFTDHLGNVRLSYSDTNKDGIIQPRQFATAKCTPGKPPFNIPTCIVSWQPGEIVESNTYYPFGLLHNYTATTQNAYQYKYNGKELQETGMYDYGARMYMPDLGRWGVVDPLAESYRRWSPYHYAMNNPVKFTDPDGMGSYDENGEWHSEMEDFWNYHGYANGPTQNSYSSYSSLTYNSGTNPDGGGGGSVTVGDLLDALLASSNESSLSSWMKANIGNGFSFIQEEPNPIRKYLKNKTNFNSWGIETTEIQYQLDHENTILELNR
ncbi:RHS repeat-associated core domain-containing protein [Chryseobacterium indoltheticum]|nr:RHS repeat-associated core domain-containing protein [Chryseobacterium indoltheticum]